MTLLSPERTGRITSSRIGAILGYGRNGNTRPSVLREMVREIKGEPPLTRNPFLEEMAEHGHMHEMDALAAYERITGVVTHSHQQFIIHPEFDFLAATVDARVGRHGIVEAKAPPRAKFRSIAERPDIDVQMRLQVECAGAEYADLVVWRPDIRAQDDNVDIDHLERDPWWLESIMPKLEKFMADLAKAIEE